MSEKQSGVHKRTLSPMWCQLNIRYTLAIFFVVGSWKAFALCGRILPHVDCIPTLRVGQRCMSAGQEVIVHSSFGFLSDTS